MLKVANNMNLIMAHKTKHVFKSTEATQTKGSAQDKKQGPPKQNKNVISLQWKTENDELIDESINLNLGYLHLGSAAQKERTGPRY